MSGARIIRRVDCSSPTFLRSLKAIRDPQRSREVVDAIRKLLLLDLDAAPASLHLHQLVNRKVPSAVVSGQSVPAWTFHVTKDDALKASFTLENDTAYLRLCDAHDVVDKNP